MCEKKLFVVDKKAWFCAYFVKWILVFKNVFGSYGKWNVLHSSIFDEFIRKLRLNDDYRYGHWPINRFPYKKIQFLMKILCYIGIYILSWMFNVHQFSILIGPFNLCVRSFVRFDIKWFSINVYGLMNFE